ncbi:hypothetical protein RRF57_006734 [Xylaria bambusicola]|uniref:Protein kinase domain-containing protein n=1 Tax=Xylaria bambusicola TaxID=326684 RepID=A0AAN7UT30_9PEZI
MAPYKMLTSVVDIRFESFTQGEEILLLQACMGRTIVAAPFVRANLGWNAGDELFEEIPDQRRRWAGKHFVHFDLDLKNIFIYGTDARARDNEHRIVPGLKIGELGHSEDVKIRKTNAYYFNMRGKGRFGYYTPEQFCQDWHYISKPDGSIVDPDGPEVSEQPVAGNYGSATNVWGIGLIMWQLMTRMQPPVPPQPQPEIQLGPGMVIPTHYCPLLLTMREYDVYDLELRLVVAYCLTANPQLRPALSNLLNAARRGIDSNFIGEDDNTIREWVRRFIYNPI